MRKVANKFLNCTCHGNNLIQYQYHAHELPDNSKDFGTTHFEMEMARINSIYIKKTEQRETDATNEWKIYINITPPIMTMLKPSTFVVISKISYTIISAENEAFFNFGIYFKIMKHKKERG